MFAPRIVAARAAPISISSRPRRRARLSPRRPIGELLSLFAGRGARRHGQRSQGARADGVVLSGASTITTGRRSPAASRPRSRAGQRLRRQSSSASTCHEEARKVWDKTAHARAYATLSKEFKEYNLDCVSCHVTGYEKPGGSTVTLNDIARDVQCEECHGPGQAHAKAPKKGPHLARAQARDLRRFVPPSAARRRLRCGESEGIHLGPGPRHARRCAVARVGARRGPLDRQGSDDARDILRAASRRCA